jgi:hypothetical protein
MHGVAPQCAVKEARPSLGGEAGGRSPGFIFTFLGGFTAAESDEPQSQIVLYYGVLATLRDAILDEAGICRASHDVAAPH